MVSKSRPRRSIWLRCLARRLRTESMASPIGMFPLMFDAFKNLDVSYECDAFSRKQLYQRCECVLTYHDLKCVTLSCFCHSTEEGPAPKVYFGFVFGLHYEQKVTYPSDFHFKINPISKIKIMSPAPSINDPHVPARLHMTSLSDVTAPQF